MNRLRIAWVAPIRPYPAWGGNHQRHFALLRATAGKHDVTLFFPDAGSHTELPAELRNLARVVPVISRGASFGGVRRLMRRVAGHLDCMVPTNIVALSAAVAAAASSENFDIAIGGLSVAPAVRSASALVTIIDHQNVESVLYDQLWRREPRVLRRLARRHDAWLVAGIERRWLPRASAITVCSADDAHLLEKTVFGLPPVSVIPNGVDLQRVVFADSGRDRRRVLMIGGMSYAPNVDGALFLVRDVMPAVWSEFPDVHVEIVGANPVPEVLALRGNRVTVTGAVNDTTPFLHRSTLEVVPLRTGGGTRLKILEAMAAGIPIVSTSIGAAGLGLSDGNELLLADTAADLASAMKNVLRNPDATRDMTRTARQRVEASYDWSAIGEDFVRFLEGRLSARSNGMHAAR